MEEALKPMITLFAQSSIDAAESTTSSEREKYAETARVVRRALYNKAEEIWGRKKAVKAIQERSLGEDVQYYSQRIARVPVEDADCPSAGLASSDIALLLRAGKSPSEIFGGVRILICEKCPSCKREKVKAVIVGGRIHCPHCKSSAKYDC